MAAAGRKPTRVTKQRGDVPISVWCGNYGFGRDDSFFLWAATFGSKYVDKKRHQRPPEVDFYDELERLRRSPAEGQVLLDQLEHRWRHPDCPASLYVVTLKLRAPDGEALVAKGDKLVPELLCTKVGRAKNSIAARIKRYRTEVLGGVPVVEGSQSLRVVIYGTRAAMLLESQVQEVARDNGSRAEVVDRAGKRRHVGTETYVGVGMVDPIGAFAQGRMSTP